MSERFSVRNELQKFSNLNDCQETTRYRLWQVFANHEVLTHNNNVTRYDIVEDLLSYFGREYKMEYNSSDHRKNISELKKYICHECEWYHVYDFVEKYLKSKNNSESTKRIINEFNDVLEDEQTGYHIIHNLITPITNPTEIEEIEKVIEIVPEHVEKSIKKSLELFSKKPTPDYNNAIKEIITAVEALCCTIVAESGEDADTLGKAVNKLSSCGIVLNEHLKTAIKELYKYTCNEDGKRHGGTTFVESSAEDARFMIVTCSAIINYLMVKRDSVKEGSAT